MQSNTRVLCSTESTTRMNRLEKDQNLFLSVRSAVKEAVLNVTVAPIMNLIETCLVVLEIKYVDSLSN